MRAGATMKADWVLVIALGGISLIGAFATAQAQQAQIPPLEVCNRTTVGGLATVQLDSRKDATHAGTFLLRIDVRCTPPGYPAGTMSIVVDMTDSLFKGTVSATQFDQVTSAGTASPIAFMSGRCTAEKVDGCRFWLMVADNAKDKAGDVVGFLVVDGTGKRFAYGAGSVDTGDITVSPSAW